MSTYTGSRPKSTTTACTDPFARVRDHEQLDLIDELDDAYDKLPGRALNGDNGIYALAQVVRAAADYLANLRLSAAR